MEKFTNAETESDPVLQAALTWFVSITGLQSSVKVSASKSEKRYRSLPNMKCLRLWRTLEAFDTEPSLIYSMLKTILQMQKLPDQMLLMTIDALAWVNSFDGEFVSLSVDEMVRCLLSAPFIKPEQDQAGVLSKFLMCNKSRSDAYAVIIRYIRQVFNTFTYRRNGDTTYHITGTLQEQRLLWCLSILVVSEQKIPPSHFQAPLFAATFDKIISLTAGQCSKRLSDLLAQVKKYLEPKTLVISATREPLLAVLVEEHAISDYLASCKQQSEAIQNETLLPQQQHTMSLSNNLYDKDELIATLEGIWVQIDTNVDRLVLNGVPVIQEQALDETLVSSSCGVLDISYSTMIWYGIESDTVDVTSSNLKPAITFHYPSIRRFSLGRVADGGSLPYAIHNHLFETRRHDPTLGVKAFYLSIYTQNTHYKLYSFFDDEIRKLLDILSSATGMTPYKESQMEIIYIVSLSTHPPLSYHKAKKLELTRRHVLYQLLQSTNPWIEHSAELIKVIRRLTQEHEPQTIYDMELLYHSCRLETEVTKEAIHNLRLVWHNSQSEMARFKVLAIIDRLLDRSIMRQGEANFIIMYRWLRHLEETVSPYKSAESLRIVLILLQRAKMVQTEPLTPIHRFTSSFEGIADYSKFFKYFTGNVN